VSTERSPGEVSDKIELIKSILKELHRGVSVEELKAKFKQVLSMISPLEIPFIEQQLVREGVKVEEILKLCDLHVALFREALEQVELRGVPRGHPIDLLVRENEWILKNAEALGLYAARLVNTSSFEEARILLENTLNLANALRKIRLHYRKVQMLIFPYLERRGIVAVPRVLWGREDQVIVKLRSFFEKASRAIQENSLELAREAGKIASEIASEIAELVFRENKILYPTILSLLTEGEWSAIAMEADRIGWIIDVDTRDWKPSAQPVFPYMIKPEISREQLAKLPIAHAVKPESITPDHYEVFKEGDLELDTGFLTPEEIEGLFKALPLEITYANRDLRVRFYSASDLSHGFVRTKTIVGRRVVYCHPPRLEKLVEKVALEVLNGQAPYRVFWTKQGDRIIRVLIAPVKNRSGEIIGVVEIVEDLTDVVENPEEIKKNILVL